MGFEGWRNRSQSEYTLEHRRVVKYSCGCAMIYALCMLSPVLPRSRLQHHTVSWVAHQLFFFRSCEKNVLLDATVLISSIFVTDIVYAPKHHYLTYFLSAALL